MARKISVRVDKEVLEKIDKIAEAYGMNRSELIREALKMLLAEKTRESRGEAEKSE